MASSVRVWGPSKARCSMRWDMPARPSGACREPVSTHTPTATDRTCSIRSVTTRMPLGGTLFRYPSLTGTAFSGARRIRRLWVLELFLVGERRLLAQRHLAGEPHLAVAVDLDDLDEDLVTLGQHVLDRANPVLGDLRDVQEPLGVGDDLHERAELDDLLDLTEVDPVELDLAADVLDYRDRPLDRRLVRREHGDPAVVLDVDLGARLLLDPPHDLAAGADDFADLLLADLDRDEPGRVRAQLGTRLLDRLAHLGEHGHPRLASLAERFAHDLERDARNLDVHLERRDPLLRSGDLEVHIAVVVLAAQDVGQDPEFVAFLDEPHRDAGDVGLDRHARVHERERRAAHRRHRGRPVGLEDVRHDADRVREVRLRRKHRLDGTFGEGAVADVPPGGPAEPPDLTHRERGKVVVEQEAAPGLALERLDLLLVGLGAERRGHQCLRLAAREERRAVGPRQVPHLDRDRPDLVELPAVQAEALLDDQPPDLCSLDRLEGGARVIALRLVQGERRPDLVEHAADSPRPFLLLGRRERNRELRRSERPHARLELPVPPGVRVERPARLSRPRDQVFLEPGEAPALGVAEGDRLEHGLLRHLVGARLDHQDRLLSAGDDQLEARHGLLGVRRVCDELAVHQSDPQRAYGTVERDARQAQRHGGAVHCQDVGIVLLVGGDREADDLNLVTKATGKEWADRPVNQPGRQRLFLRGRALPSEVPAGNPATRVHALAVLDREREEVLSFLPGLAGDARGEHHRATVADDDRSVSLPSNLAGLDGERLAVDVGLYGMTHLKDRPRVSAGIRRTPCRAGDSAQPIDAVSEDP